MSSNRIKQIKSAISENRFSASNQAQDINLNNYISRDHSKSLVTQGAGILEDLIKHGSLSSIDMRCSMNALQKLVLAYESRDFTILSLLEIIQLVQQRYINIETATRLAMVVQHGG